MKHQRLESGRDELFEMIINDINQISTMTMNCPSCGTLMIWLNGSIMHDQQINFYECRNCKIKLNTLSDGSYEITQQDSEHRLE
ncbi:MAG: hypothetical protein ACM31M_03690 [Nitrososphaerota archaeon]